MSNMTWLIMLSSGLWLFSFMYKLKCNGGSYYSVPAHQNLKSNIFLLGTLVYNIHFVRSLDSLCAS